MNTTTSVWFGIRGSELLRPGVLGGREDEVQPLQGVDSLMTKLLPLEQFRQSAVELLQLRFMDLPVIDKQFYFSHTIY